MSKLNVKPEHLKMLTDIFENYCPNAEIWAYGSRVNGDSHDGSDLDMVVKNFNDENKNIAELRQMLNDSNIPFLMDISEFDRMPNYMQSEILKNYVIIYNK